MTRSRFTDPKDYRKMAAAEEARVQEIIERDQRYEQQERFRREAELEVAGGKVSLMPDTAVEPTPEWLEKGEVETFIPRQAEGTTVLIKTKRRRQNTVIAKLWATDQITDKQAIACIWYRDRFESAGLEGRYKSSHISMTAGTSGGGGGGGQAPMAQHEGEAAARSEYRDARDSLTAFYLKFFEAVVIHDIPLHRAARFARCRTDKVKARFRAVAQEMVEHCEAINVRLERD